MTEKRGGPRDRRGEGPGRPGGLERPPESGRLTRPEEGLSGGSVRFMARIIQQAAPYIAAVWVLTGAVLLLGLGGWWLDGRWGTSPWLTTVGLLLGVVVGMYELARVALKGGPPPGTDR